MTSFNIRGAVNGKGEGSFREVVAYFPPGSTGNVTSLLIGKL